MPCGVCVEQAGEAKTHARTPRVVTQGPDRVKKLIALATTKRKRKKRKEEGKEMWVNDYPACRSPSGARSSGSVREQKHLLLRKTLRRCDCRSLTQVNIRIRVSMWGVICVYLCNNCVVPMYYSSFLTETLTPVYIFFNGL